jgi:hypothetical protein
MIYAFDEDHASIIHSKEVLEQYNTIINTFDGQSGGYLICQQRDGFKPPFMISRNILARLYHQIPEKSRFFWR